MIRKSASRLFAALVPLLALCSCMATHEISYYPSARITDGNYAIVRTVDAEVSYRYVFGIGGMVEKDIVNMLKDKACLAAGEQLANVNIHKQNSVYLGVVIVTRFTAGADVVVFGPAAPVPGAHAAPAPLVAAQSAAPLRPAIPAATAVPAAPVSPAPVHEAVKAEPEAVAANPQEPPVDEPSVNAADLLDKTYSVVMDNGQTYEYHLLGLRAGRYEFIFRNKSGKKLHIDPKKVVKFVLDENNSWTGEQVHEIIRSN